MIESKYLDYTITGTIFHIVESFSKPRNSDAITVLAKIEFIVKNKLSYHSEPSDIYSNQTRSEIYRILEKQASQIHKKYHESLLKLNWLAEVIFTKENQIVILTTKIYNHINPSQLLALPHELIQKITEYLKVSAINSLAQINCCAKVQAADAIARRAREFGYEGRDSAEAAKDVRNLFYEVQRLSTIGIIPQKYRSYKKQKIDSEETLENLRDLSSENIFSILASEELYSTDFQEFRKLFNPEWKWRVTKTDGDNTKQQGSKALVLAAKNGDKSILKFLLQHGADPNIAVESEDFLSFSDLHFSLNLLRLRPK